MFQGYEDGPPSANPIESPATAHDMHAMPGGGSISVTSLRARSAGPARRGTRRSATPLEEQQQLPIGMPPVGMGLLPTTIFKTGSTEPYFDRVSANAFQPRRPAGL